MRFERVAGPLHVHTGGQERPGDRAGGGAGDARHADDAAPLQRLHRFECGQEMRDLRAAALNGQLNRDGHGRSHGREKGGRHAPAPSLLRGPSPP